MDSTPLPWTRSCFVCGEANPHGLARRLRREGDRIVCDFTAAPEHQGWNGIVHGGITTALLDEVMTWAAILGHGKPVVAAELGTRLRLPVVVGGSYRVEGTLAEGSRPRLVRTTARILDASGQECATATGKYMPSPAATLEAADFVAAEGLPTLATLLGESAAHE